MYLPNYVYVPRATIFQSWKRTGMLKKKLTFWMASLIVAFKTGEIVRQLPIYVLNLEVVDLSTE